MALARKIIFIDRDGTIIREPADEQNDSIEKFELMPNIIPALQQLIQAGFELVMVSNQDGLGTNKYQQQDFDQIQTLLLGILASQSITFSEILICPHKPINHCDCRKPKIGLVIDYLRTGVIDAGYSVVIGDRRTDLDLANNIGIKGLLYQGEDWLQFSRQLLQQPRKAEVVRSTKETTVTINLDLDDDTVCRIDTGIGFFDHMLEQIIKHAGIAATIQVQGDLEVDEHHTIEDTALALGTAIKKALGDKRGIERYGFLLPMDEALAQIALDLSGRSYCQFNAEFSRETVGGLAIEMVPHFFRSVADGLGATINISVTGENCHHMIESTFKGLGRVLKQAITKTSNTVPSTKEVIC